MKRLLPILLAGAALSAGGLVYAQQAAPAGPPIDTGEYLPPPESPADPLGALLEEAPPAEAVGPGLLPPSDPALTAAENEANELAEAEVAEEVPPEELEPPPPPPAPLPRPRKTAAILQAVDKVTAETLRFEAKVGQPVRYKTLIFTVRACETTAEDEDHRDEMAHIEVVSQPRTGSGGRTIPARQIFRGWTFQSSPGLNPFEHPVYDAWLIACKA
jgi:hypothetical protein